MVSMLKYKVLSQKILKYPWPAKRFLLLMTYSVYCIRPYFISVSYELIKPTCNVQDEQKDSRCTGPIYLRVEGNNLVFNNSLAPAWSDE